MDQQVSMWLLVCFVGVIAALHAVHLRAAIASERSRKAMYSRMGNNVTTKNIDGPDGPIGTVTTYGIPPQGPGGAAKITLIKP